MAEPFDDDLSVTHILSKAERQKMHYPDPPVRSWWQRIPAIALLLLLALGCQQLADQHFPQLDEQASVYFIETSQKAVLSYAMVRSANAAVSVVQESELLISPTGVGVSLAVGQVLDPLNDLLERTSTVLVAALVSIGVQRVALELSQSVSLSIAAICFLLAALAACFAAYGREVQYWMLRLAFIFLLLRLALPASAVIYDQSYQHWFAPQIEQAQQVLQVIPGTNEFAAQYTAPANAANSLLGQLLPDAIGQQWDNAQQKIHWLQRSFTLMIQHASELVSALVQLISTYAAMFILQVIVLPLASLWLIVAISHWFATWISQRSNSQ